VNSKTIMRPPRPANTPVNSNIELPGALITNAVARRSVNSIDDLRPPRPASNGVNSNP
jgi:hypothetical protein